MTRHVKNALDSLRNLTLARYKPKYTANQAREIHNLIMGLPESPESITFKRAYEQALMRDDSNSLQKDFIAAPMGLIGGIEKIMGRESDTKDENLQFETDRSIRDFLAALVKCMPGDITALYTPKQLQLTSDQQKKISLFLKAIQNRGLGSDVGVFQLTDDNINKLKEDSELKGALIAAGMLVEVCDKGLCLDAQAIAEYKKQKKSAEISRRR